MVLAEGKEERRISVKRRDEEESEREGVVGGMGIKSRDRGGSGASKWRGSCCFSCSAAY